MNNVLFLSDSPHRFTDQISFANKIVKKNVDVFFFISEAVYDEYPIAVSELKFKIINGKSQGKKNNIFNFFIDILNGRKLRFIADMRNMVYDSFLFESKAKKREEKYFSVLDNTRKKLTKIVAENKINLMLLNGDRNLGYESIFLSIATSLSIPIVIPYMVYFAEKEELVRKGIKVLPPILSSRYSKNSQNRFKIHSVCNRFFYPNYIANSLNRLGILSDNPWFVGGGISNILCLPNIHMKNHYIKNLINESKIRVLGDVAYDTLYRSTLKKEKITLEVIKNYDLNPNRNIIIIALPQLAEHGIVSWRKHWQEIIFLMDSVSSLNKNVLISLHPRMSRDSYLFLEKNYNCKILNERLSAVLVSADMFVSTFSSTVLWSTICGIKTLVVDFYGLNYSIYDFLTSVEIINKKKNLKTALCRLISSQIDFTSDWERLSKEKVFDGNTIERYSNLITEMVKYERDVI